VRYCLVNGPNSLITWWGPGTKNPTGTKPARVYTLDPTKCYWQQIYPRWGGVPYEVQAIITGKFANANLVVNIPTDASDDLVYAIAQRVRDNFPAGRTVYVELSNEPWNWAFNPFGQLSISGGVFLRSNPSTLAYYAFRSIHCRDVFRTVFGARSAEICGYLNCQMGDNAAAYLNYAQANGWQIDAIACAPYASPTDSPANVAGFNALDDDQAIDLYVHDLLYCPDSIAVKIAGTQAAIKAYNSATGNNCRLICYEGGNERVAPAAQSGAPYNDVRSRDCIYNPLFYFAEQTHYAILQAAGVSEYHIYGAGLPWAPQGWGLYHAYNQDFGRGDGSDGKANNRLFLADPKAAGYKGATVNQDSKCVSVRGQAWLDWNAAVTSSSSPAKPK
jgi:hypothetical protein